MPIPPGQFTEERADNVIHATNVDRPELDQVMERHLDVHFGTGFAMREPVASQTQQSDEVTQRVVLAKGRVERTGFLGQARVKPRVDRHFFGGQMRCDLALAGVKESSNGRPACPRPRGTRRSGQRALDPLQSSQQNAMFSTRTRQERR